MQKKWQFIMLQMCSYIKMYKLLTVPVVIYKDPLVGRKTPNPSCVGHRFIIQFWLFIFIKPYMRNNHSIKSKGWSYTKVNTFWLFYMVFIYTICIYIMFCVTYLQVAGDTLEKSRQVWNELKGIAAFIKKH